MEKVAEIAGDTRSQTKKTYVAHDWELAGLTASPEGADGEYEGRMEASKAIAAVVRKTADLGNGSPNHIHHSQKRLLDWIDAKKAEQLALFDSQ